MWPPAARFAQHITVHMCRNGLRVLDYEPAPPGLSPEVEKQYGYNIYSARYENIYVVRQLLQLAEDAIAGEYDPAVHVFHNFTSREIYDDFVRFLDLIKPRNPGVKMLLTVSRVALTATASENHVLVATPLPVSTRV